LLTW